MVYLFIQQMVDVERKGRRQYWSEWANVIEITSILTYFAYFVARLRYPERIIPGTEAALIEHEHLFPFLLVHTIMILQAFWKFMWYVKCNVDFERVM